MSNVDKLLEKGAQIVGGDLILRHQVVGKFRHGDFILTPEGEAELEITDVIVREVPTVEVKPVEHKRGRKPKATPPADEDVTIDI